MISSRDVPFLIELVVCHIFGAELSKGMDDLSRLTYLRFGVFRRFFRDFLLPGVCKVDQQNACTSKIPISAPQLSIPTSLTEGPRASTKD